MSRVTVEVPGPGDASARDASGTATSWTRTGARRWGREFTWLLPAAIVTLLVVSGVAVLAFLLHSRLVKQEQELERMSRVTSGKDRVKALLPPRSDHEPAAPVRVPDVDDEVSGPEMVKLDVPGLPEGALVEMDGRQLPQLPILLPRDDLEHVLRVEAPGFEPWEVDLRLEEDVTLEVQLKALVVGPVKKGSKKSIEQPPIDTTYPGVIGKKKGK